MSARNWKFYYKKTEYESFFEKIVNTLLQWAALVMLWASFWSIVREIYPEFMPDRKVHLIWGIWMLLLWIGYEVLLPRMKSRRWLIWALIPAFHIVVFLAYYFKNHTMIWHGLLGVANSFLIDYNLYYHTSFYVGGGVVAYGVVAVTFVVFILWFIQWNLVCLFRKKWLYLMLPVLAFVLELSVGYSPLGAGAALFFLASLMIVATQESSHIQGVVQGGKKPNREFSVQRICVKAAVLFLVVLSLLISDVVYQDELALLINQKPALVALQDKLFRFEIHTDVDVPLDIQFDKEKLDNNTPRYLAKKVLTMIVDREPSSNIYLKGYNGNIYEDSVWSGDYSPFLEACNRHHAEPEDVTEALFQSGYKQLEILPNSHVINYSIQYEQRGNRAYIPYFTDYASLGNGYSVTGDYLLKKGDAIKKMTGTGLDVSGFGASGQYEIDPKKYDFTLGDYSWYEDTVTDIYTEVPTDLWFTIDALGIKSLKDGQDAMGIAEGVKKYLANNMDYNLQLDKLSEREDPIWYFLTQSKEGYCMHFASAGTMMLRYLGVPARYVSGYVIHQGAFYKTEAGYVGIARDRNAHAWVEIFVEGIGWLPVEMTPGYESTADRLPTDSQKEDTDQTEELTEEPTEGPTETETESEHETESQNTSLTPMPSESESEEKSEKDTEGTKPPEQSGNKNKELLAKIWPILSSVLGIGVLIVLIYLGCRRWIRHYHSVLERLVQKKCTRLAVRKMHRRVYRYLRLRKGCLRGLRDNEMEELLIVTYPCLSEEEWRQYMEIAKKMYFSKEEISEEEMMHCYHCYEMVTNVFFKKQQ